MQSANNYYVAGWYENWLSTGKLKHMYIGIGTLVVIVIVFLILRRR